MDDDTIAQFFALLDAVVNAAATASEKVAALRAVMDDDDWTNLQELAAWFGFFTDTEGEDEGGAAA